LNGQKLIPKIEIIRIENGNSLVATRGSNSYL